MEKIIIAVVGMLWVGFFGLLYVSRSTPKKKILNLKPRKKNYIIADDKKVNNDDDIKIFQGFKKEEDKLSGYKVIIPRRPVEEESEEKANVVNVSQEVFINKKMRNNKKKKKKTQDNTMKIGY